MKWIQDNPFLAGLAALILVGIGVQVFFLNQSMTRYAETSAAYGESVQKLQALQNRSPFPKDENLKQTEVLAEEFKNELRALRTQLAGMEAPLNPDVTPQQFSDDLRERVDQVLEKAAKVGVALPEGFYLGFDGYSNRAPTPEAAPALARQLFIIDKLVTRLINYKVRSIDALARRPLPEELAAGAEKVKVVQRYVIDLAFTSEQSKFRVAFNSLLGSDEFLIVRALSVQNSNTAGPLITRAEAVAFPAEGAGGAASPAKQSEHLEVILGQELVTVTTKIEILDFAEPEVPKE
jgi:hypothetical protein